VTRHRILSLAFEAWPSADQVAWRQGVAPTSDLFADVGGAADRLSRSTLRKRQAAHGTWLSFLERSGVFDPAVPAVARVTPARLDAWIAEQRVPACATARSTYACGISMAR